MKHRLLLADDHLLVRETLSAYLLGAGGLEISQAGTLDEVVELIGAQERFDIIVLDFSMPGMNALEGLRRILALCPDTPVAIISGTVTPDTARRAIHAGAAGFLPKTLAPVAILEAITSVIAGEKFVPQDFMTAKYAPSGIGLTPREKDVLRGLTDGKSNKEIARDLGVQEVTIKLHVKTLSRKLDARNRTHAAMLGRDLDLI